MDCSRPLALSANSYMDLDHYKYTTVDEAACKAKPGFWLAKIDLKHAYEVLGLTHSGGKSLACLGFFKVLALVHFCLINAFHLVLEPLL